MMLKRIVVLVLCGMVFFVGCKFSPTKREQTIVRERMQGNWVCADVLEQLKQTRSVDALDDFPPYTELIFSADSNTLAAVNGQVEVVHLTYERKGNLVQVEEFYGSGTTVLTLSGDSVLIFANEALGRQWRYVRVPEAMENTEGELHEAFPTAVNAILVAGEYTVTNAEKPYTLTLRCNGYIFGSPHYTRYKICYSGDCTNLSDRNLVYLFNGSEGNYYGWQWHDDELIIYALRTVNTPDAITAYEYGKPLRVLKKK